MQSNVPLKLIVAAIVGVCALILFFSTYYTVGQYERGVLTRFGKVVEVSEPGLHFKVPFVNSVHMYRTDILSLSTPKELNGGTGVSTYTVDNQEVHVVFTVQYRLHADKVAFIYENVQDLQARLFQIAEDRLKAEFGKVNTSHVAENRGKIRDGIKAVMQEATRTLGVDVVDFQLNNIEYDKTFKGAVQAAAAARATVETREQERMQAIKVAEKVKIEAEGQANAVKMAADGEAYRVKTEAQAWAYQLKVKAEAVQNQGPVVLELKRIEVEQTKADKWDGALPVRRDAVHAVLGAASEVAEPGTGHDL